MSLISNFNDLKVSGTVGTEIMNMLGIYPEELNEPVTFNKFQDIVSYLSKFSSSERNKLIRNIGKGETDKFNTLWQYCAMADEIEEIQDEIDEIDEYFAEMKSLGVVNSQFLKDNVNRLTLKEELSDKLGALKEDLSEIY